MVVGDPLLCRAPVVGQFWLLAESRVWPGEFLADSGPEEKVTGG